MMTDAERLQQWADVPRELAEIVVAYAGKYGFTVKELRGPSRKADRVWVRRSIAKIARRGLTPFSYWQIGRALNRDNSTVRNLVQRSLATQNGRRG
jgi:chromosomal replication initiation ATPase DnaA